MKALGMNITFHGGSKKQTKRIVAALESIAESLVAIKRSLSRPAKPGLLSIINLRELEPNVITFDVALPALSTPHDVVRRELTVTVDGGTPDVRTANPEDASVTGFSVPQDASVSLSLVDIDDAGNPSAPSTLTYVAADTVPPAQPGELGITNVRETP
jgi:hypothetical protein